MIKGNLTTSWTCRNILHNLASGPKVFDEVDCFCISRYLNSLAHELFKMGRRRHSMNVYFVENISEFSTLTHTANPLYITNNKSTILTASCAHI